MGKVHNPPDTSNLVPYRGATSDLELGSNDIELDDNAKIIFGTGGDAEIAYDGVNIRFDLAVVGTGHLQIRQGNIVLVNTTTGKNNIQYGIRQLAVGASGPVTNARLVRTSPSGRASSVANITNETGYAPGEDGQIVTIIAGAANITLEDGTGNMRLNGDWVPATAGDTLTLVYDGTVLNKYLEISRSIN